MSVYILDAEWYVEKGNDVVLGAEKLHCVVFKEYEKNNTITFTDFSSPEPMREFLSVENNTYVGHNIITADFEVFRRLLGIPYSISPDSINGVPCKFIDTLTMSRRNNPDRPMAYYKGKSCGSHGLKSWGIRTGLQKPEVADWTSQELEVYVNRCTKDVHNNEVVYTMLLEERAECL